MLEILQLYANHSYSFLFETIIVCKWSSKNKLLKVIYNYLEKWLTSALSKSKRINMLQSNQLTNQSISAEKRGNVNHINRLVWRDDSSFCFLKRKISSSTSNNICFLMLISLVVKIAIVTHLLTYIYIYIYS